MFCKIFFTDEKVSTTNLNTVTYGTACAAFLVIRSLHEVAYVLHDFYADDLLSGANFVQGIFYIKQ